jgi:hypothetical protein
MEALDRMGETDWISPNLCILNTITSANESHPCSCDSNYIDEDQRDCRKGAVQSSVTLQWLPQTMFSAKDESTELQRVSQVFNQ